MKKKFIICTLFLLSLLLVTHVTIKSDAFKGYALNKLNSYIEEKTNGALKIEQLEVSFPFTLVLKNITHKNFEISQASFSLSLRKLIHGKIHIRHLNIEDFEIKAGSQSSKKEDSAANFSLSQIPDFFSSFKLSNFNIKNFKFQDHLVDIAGKVLSDVESRSINILIDVTGHEFSKIKSSIILKTEGSNLNADISLKQLSRAFNAKAIINESFLINLENVSGNIDNVIINSKQLKIKLSPFIINGKINGHFQADDLSQLNSSGMISFNGHFGEDKNNIQTLQVLFHSLNLNSFGFDCRQLSAKAYVKNLYDFRDVDLTVMVKEASKNVSGTIYKISDLNFQTLYNSQTPFSVFHLKVKENDISKSNIEAFGKYGYENENFILSIDECKGLILDQPIALTKSFTLKLKDDFWQVSPIQGSFGEATFVSSFKKNQKTGSLLLQVSHFPLKLLTRTIETGFLDADLELSGDLQKPLGEINLKIQDFKTNYPSLSLVSPLQAACTIKVDNTCWQLLGTVKDLKQNPIDVKLQIPISLSLFPFSFYVDRKADLSANFRLNGRLAPLVECFKESASNLTGNTTIAIDIDGSIDNPHFKSAGEIIEGTFEIPETGALYKNIYAKFQSDDRKLEFNELTATDAFQGTIKGHGTVDLNIEKYFPFAFFLEIENTKLLRLDYATATGNGQLKLTGDLNGALLEGKVVADEAKVLIPEESPILVSSVDVIYINQSETDLLRSVYETKVAYWPINMDITFDVKKPFSINGKDLKSRWKGALNVKGSFQQPELFGEFKIVDGEYKFQGKVFEILEGKIIFAGEIKKTSLYVIGGQEIANIRAEVILKGPLKSPAISFRSNPPMPQREILSWILFGHGAKDLNAFEGSHLNQSITDLNKGSSGTDFLTKIRNKIGIDTIDINHNSESENNEVSIKVGKYISRGLLVSVNKSISAGANRLEIEAKLFKDIKAQAEIGDDAEGQLNLKWKKDY